jgi:hypothetical protein
MCDSADRPANRARGGTRKKGRAHKAMPRTKPHLRQATGKGRAGRAQTLAIPRSKPRKLRKGKTRSEGRKAKSGKAPTVIHTGLAQEPR